jgi:hypothetical protein
MTLYEIQSKARETIAQLRVLRDDIGAILSDPGTQPGRSTDDTRRLSELHDRLANAISAYSRGA